MTKKILLYAGGFVSWPGGVDYFINLALGFGRDEQLEIYVLIPHNPLKEIIKRTIARPNKELTQNIDRIMTSLEEIAVVRKVRFEEISVLWFALRTGTQLVGPVMRYNIFLSPFKVFGYIFDFQYKYLPENFSQSQAVKIEKTFSRLIENCEAILVGSQQVRNDAIKFLKADYRKIFVTKILQSNAKIKEGGEHIHINDEFFICCNQLWKHKNHKLLIHAFSKFREMGGKADLILTGSLEDYRNPEYYNEIVDLIAELQLNDYVKILGLLPKSKQLDLMQHAVAVVQPTLFEGGPGGGSVYDAMALRKTIILSDIEVNREIDEVQNVYFKSNSIDDLACKLLMVELGEIKSVYPHNSIGIFGDNRKTVANTLRQMIKHLEAKQ